MAMQRAMRRQAGMGSAPLEIGDDNRATPGKESRGGAHRLRVCTTPHVDRAMLSSPRRHDAERFPMSERYFEDFAVGDVFKPRGRVQVKKEEIVAFAKKFDPQTFHIDEE